MTSTEEKLKERIKELTCLYEVTSIIAHSDFSMLDKTFEAVINCLQRAWKVQHDAQVALYFEGPPVVTNRQQGKLISIRENIRIFNEIKGYIEVSYPADRYQLSDFLMEEKMLLKNVCFAVGNHLEKKEIRDNEIAIKRQVERADRLHILGEITAGIAHELNTPLANILGFAELLKNGITKEEHRRDLDKIVGNAIFSREVVKKLMFFACEMPQQMKSVSLRPIIEDVIKLLRPSLTQKNITLTQLFEVDSLELKADPIQLTQVLFNLIMNAIYYSPTNGEIVVEIKEKPSEIILKIKDEGEGIPTNLRDKIFEPFYTTKPTGDGSGLGLSVVHGIIKSHKGSIKYSANRPKGSIFTIKFPKN
ncbi:HAMP domain-containing histidine kinase [Flavobacteriaceae bacterium F08102]|nr:HAMP domain-containing histidine kinase [Flavobacteriaceae bacterium F08102]